MITFSSIDVVKTRDNFHYISWDVTYPGMYNAYSEPPAEDDVREYYFVVYWSNDPKSGYHSIKDDDGNDVQIDGDIGPLEFNVMHKRKHNNFNNKYYYCVVAYNKTVVNKAVKSEPVYYGQYNDGVHIQIKYAEDTLYEMYYGEPCVVIKRKPYGKPCPNCWSKERQQRTKSNCSVCNNSGKVFGYYKPIQMQISFDSDPVSSNVQANYEVVTDTKRGRLSNYPIVRPRDLIVNLDDNKRYAITNIDTTKLPLRATYDKSDGIKMSRQNYVVSQLLTMQEIPADDQEYYMDYCNIPSDCDDFSLPRFQTHQPATGEGAIDVDDNQVVRLNYSDDFVVNPVTGNLEIRRPLESTSKIIFEYKKDGGVNLETSIPPTFGNLLPELDGVELVLTGLIVSCDVSNNINDGTPPEYNASVSLYTEDVTTAVTTFDINTATEVFMADFVKNDDQPGIKFYPYYVVEAPTGSAEVILPPGNMVFVSVNPNDGWAFDTIKVSIEIELRKVL